MNIIRSAKAELNLKSQEEWDEQLLSNSRLQKGTGRERGKEVAMSGYVKGEVEAKEERGACQISFTSGLNIRLCSNPYTLSGDTARWLEPVKRPF